VPAKQRRCNFPDRTTSSCVEHALWGRFLDAIASPPGEDSLDYTMPRRTTGLLARGERRLPVRGPVTRLVATSCIARLLVLAAEDSRTPILAYIDSPAGLASEALRILSSLDGIECPVATFCRGPQGGAAVALAAHGLRGFRVCSPYARFAFKFDPENPKHRSADSCLESLTEIVARDSGRPREVVAQWFSSQTVFSAQEAIANGLIDSISAKPVIPEVTA
jgi:ATP-dependent Clp protease, protease subunit